MGPFTDGETAATWKVRLIYGHRGWFQSWVVIPGFQTSDSGPNVRRSHKHGPRATWELDHKAMFKNASSTSSVASQKQRVYGKSPPQKLNFFFIHPHLFVEKHSAMINNRIKALEQTRVLCLGFFCCIRRIFILATLVYCVA